jgi:hypothetical protein
LEVDLADKTICQPFGNFRDFARGDMQAVPDPPVTGGGEQAELAVTHPPADEI